MIIEDIEIKNFRAFKNVKISFSSSGKKNVTLIYGENGTGKTSFFYAINWCFYGRIYNKREIIPKSVRIDGKYLKDELDAGDHTYVSVKIKFSHHTERYLLERKIKVTKKNNTLIYTDEEVSLNSYNTIGQTESYSEERISRIIDSLIPVTTREYFFFDGEKIDKFSEVDNNKEIESSIRAVLGFDCIENARDYLHDAAKKYDNLISSKGDDEYNTTVKLITKLEEDKLEYEKNNEKLEKERDDAKNELNDIKKKSALFEQEKQNREKLNGIKNQIDALDSQKKTLTQDLHNSLKRSYLSFSIPLHEKCKLLMKKWSDDGVFPSEVFNEDLVNKILSKCHCIICGTKFKKNDSVYKHVEALKSETLFNREIEKELNLFNSDIKDFITKGGNNFSDIYKLFDNIKNIDNQLEELISKRDFLKENISDKLTDEELKELFEREHALETMTLPELKTKIIINDNNKKELDEEIKKTRKYKEKLQLKSESEQKNKEKCNLCEKAEESVEYIIKTYADEKRIEINDLCKKLFQALIWKESHFKNVELTEDYSLNVLDQFGEPARPDLSAGEREVLSLAFITSIAKSANKEAPFIIDTPFGRISAKPRKYIAEEIPEMVTQLILFVTDTELTKESEKIFTSKSNKVWTIKFNQKTSISSVVEGKYVD